MSRIHAVTARNLRVLIAAIAMSCVASMLWVSVAQAQEIPFDSQYAPPPTAPPTAPPTSESVPPADPAEPAPADPAPSGETAPAAEPVVSEGDDGEAVVDLLPTTGGSYLAPILLGGAVLSVTGTLVVRRIRS